MSWTETRVDLLRKLWADGLSASRIAAELGGTSRLAVIGKVHRLGLPPRLQAMEAQKIAAKNRARPRQCSGGVSEQARVERMTGVFEPVEIPPVHESDMAIPLSQRRTLAGEWKGCRWPVGDPREPDFFFCGGKPSKRAWGASLCPYCDWHADRAVVKRAA